ncbi:Formin-like protein 4 [Vitis vinifera]|uniref:Formin-like protein 4 n=1 Tax=Vitis vinifera TaxID=29760 RepID=A0A438GHJ4_VITVI|nr:Formin-like protein 4 [Vitis vinifera]
MFFRSNYDSEILHLRECLQTLELGCKELRTRGLFLKLLEAILEAGNRMNAGTSRGNAQAFNLAALQKLSDVKSTDGKNYVTSLCCGRTEMDYNAFGGVCSTLTAHSTEIKQFVAPFANSDGGFLRKMKSFLEAAGEELREVREEQTRVCVDIARNLQRRKTTTASLGPSSTKSPPSRIPVKFPNLPPNFMPDKSRNSSSSDSEDEF